jgi:hypothetical protein
MSEEANTRLGEEKDATASGLLLSVESMPGGESSERLQAQGADKVDTDTDKQDGDALVDVDGTDESDGDATDGTDTPGDSDGTDGGGDSDATDSKDSDGSDS